MSGRDRWVIGGCVVAAAWLTLQQWALVDWVIDDAAISFAYARNLAEGAGAVATAGGERVEGYSNPSWVFLLAVAHGLGLHLFPAAKILSWICSLVCLGLSWRIAQDALGGGRPRAALLAPLGLAASSPFVIWSASTLENAWFGMWALILVDRARTELKHGGAPWSAAAAVVLALTRPEGVLYVAVVGVILATLHRGRGAGIRPMVRWMGCVVGVLAGFEALRLAYYAWPLPNTYYAKIASRGEIPWGWEGPGWQYLRSWAHGLGHGYLAPLFVLGLTGVTSRRVGLAAAVSVALAWAAWWPGEAAWLDALRPMALWLPLLVLPLFASRGEGRASRLLCWGVLASGLVFTVVTGGDWMEGLRWASLVAPVSAVLLAVGTVEVADAVRGRWSRGGSGALMGGLVALALTFVWMPVHALKTAQFIDDPEDSTEMVKRRVEYTEAWRRRLLLDHVTRLDMDLGAHLWWTTDPLMDVAGLVSVPVAHHAWRDPGFAEHHVFGGRAPDIAHLHRWWGRHTGLLGLPQWDAFVALPPYQDGSQWHDGVWLHRRHVTGQVGGLGWRLASDFDRGIRLAGVDLAGPEVGVGRYWYVELGWQIPVDQQVRVQVFLAGQDSDEVASWEVLPAMGLLKPGQWEEGEVLRSRHTLQVPADLAVGVYDLGLLLLDEKDRAIAVDPESLVPGAVAGGYGEAPVRLAKGELRFLGRMRVVDGVRLTQASEMDAIAAVEQARRGRCERAERSWFEARAHQPRHGGWHDEHRPEVARAIAGCWIHQVTEHDPRTALLRARYWDPSVPEVQRLSEQTADTWWDEAHQARDQGAWSTAYARFEDVLSVAPHRSWARRYAEEARTHILATQ
jgi:hypothetical protein